MGLTQARFHAAEVLAGPTTVGSANTLRAPGGLALSESHAINEPSFGYARAVAAMTIMAATMVTFGRSFIILLR